MTLPALFFGFLVSTLIGAVFHLFRGGGIDRLLLYLVAGWVGFWGGHWIGDRLGWTFLSVGPLHMGMALIGAIGLLLVLVFFSLVTIETTE